MERIAPLKPDKRDLQLLYLLDINGRMNYSELAKKTRLSKQVAQYRIKRLEQEGFIKGYFTMIDTSRLGYTTFRVYLKLSNIAPENRKEIVNYLKSQNNIWAVVLLAGKWDIALGIAVKDIYEFYSVWEKILADYLPQISDYKTSIYSPIYHYSKAYLIEQKDISKIRILGGHQKTEFDQKDIQILIALSKDARISLLDLSEIVKMTPQAISHRIKQLEKKGIIQGYRAMIDVSKLGYEFYKAEIRLSVYDKIDLMLNFCHNHPNIYQVDKTIGGETLEVEFHVVSLQQMLSILEEFEKAFPKTIERFDYLTVLSEEKTTYMPQI